MNRSTHAVEENIFCIIFHSQQQRIHARLRPGVYVRSRPNAIAVCGLCNWLWKWMHLTQTLAIKREAETRSTKQHRRGGARRRDKRNYILLLRSMVIFGFGDASLYRTCIEQLFLPFVAPQSCFYRKKIFFFLFSRMPMRKRKKNERATIHFFVSVSRYQHLLVGMILETKLSENSLEI